MPQKSDFHAYSGVFRLEIQQQRGEETPITLSYIIPRKNGWCQRTIPPVSAGALTLHAILSARCSSTLHNKKQPFFLPLEGKGDHRRWWMRWLAMFRRLWRIKEHREQEETQSDAKRRLRRPSPLSAALTSPRPAGSHQASSATMFLTEYNKVEFRINPSSVKAFRLATFPRGGRKDSIPQPSSSEHRKHAQYLR